MSKTADTPSNAGVSLIGPDEDQSTLSDIVISDVGPRRSEWIPDVLEALLPTTSRAIREIVGKTSPQVFADNRSRSSFVREVLLDDVVDEDGEIDIGSSDAGVALERYFNALVRYSLDFDGFGDEIDEWPREKRRQRYEDIETITTIGTGRGTFNAALPVLEHGFCRVHQTASLVPTVVLCLDGDAWINVNDNRTVQSALDAIKLLGTAVDVQIVVSPDTDNYLERHFDWQDDVLSLTEGGDRSGVPAPVDGDAHEADILAEAWDRVGDLDDRGGRLCVLANLEGYDARTYADLQNDGEIDYADDSLYRYVGDLESMDFVTVADCGRHKEISLTQLGEAAQEFISPEYALVHPFQSQFDEPYADPSLFNKYSVLDRNGMEGGDDRETADGSSSSSTSEEWLAATGDADDGADYVQFIDDGPSKTIDAWPMHARLAAARRVDGINLVDHEIPELEDGRIAQLSDMEDHVQVVVQWGGSLPTLARLAAALFSDKAFWNILEPSAIGTEFENIVQEDVQEILDEEIESIIKLGMQVGWFSGDELEYENFQERFGNVRTELLARLSEAMNTSDCDVRGELYEDFHGLLASATSLYRALGKDITFHIRMPNTKMLKDDENRYNDFLRFMKETAPKQTAYGVHSGNRMLIEKRPMKLQYRLPYEVQEDDPTMDSTAAWAITGPQASLLQEDIENAIVANHNEVRDQILEGNEKAPAMEIPVATTNDFGAIKNEIASHLERKGFRTDHETLTNLTRACMSVLGTQTRGASPYDVAEAMLHLKKKPGIPLTIEQLENVLAKLPADRLVKGEKATVQKMFKSLLEADERMGRSDLIEASGISENSYDRNWRELEALEALGLVDRDDDKQWRARLIPFWADVGSKSVPEDLEDEFIPSTWDGVLFEAAVDLGLEAAVDGDLFSFPNGVRCYQDFEEIIDEMDWQRWRPLLEYLTDDLFENRKQASVGGSSKTGVGGPSKTAADAVGGPSKMEMDVTIAMIGRLPTGADPQQQPLDV